MKQNIILFCILSIQCTAYSSSPYLISFFIKPLFVPQDAQQATLLAKAGAPSIPQLFGTHLLNTGIFASYAGFSASSDSNGQILLPRMSEKPELHVFITERLTLIPLAPSKKKTIIGFTVKPKTDLQYLIFTREKDPEADTYVWKVEKAEWQPYRKIPYDALIIFADPQALISPLGTTATELSENFILPDFYITNNARTALDALRFLTLKSFVAPLSFAYSFHTQNIQKKLKGRL